MQIDRSADVASRLELVLTPEDVATRNRGLRALRVHSLTIADRTVISLQCAEPTYRRLSKDLVAPGLATSSDCILEACLLPHDERAGTTQWASRVGRIRAQLGIDRQAMHRAYHIGGQVMFSAFMEWAVKEEGLPHERSLLLANDLWQVIDLYDAASSAAFLTARDEIFGRQRTGEPLDDLLEDDGDRDSVAGVARAAGWAEQGRYAVVVLRPDRGAPPVQPEELPGQAAAMRVVWRMGTKCAVGIADLGDAPTSAFARGLPTLLGRRAGVSPVIDSLDEFWSAWRLAELAARTVTNSGEAACLEERLPAALLTARPDLAGELSTRLLTPILALDQVRRNLLIQTLAAWLTTGYSLHRTAATLSCHRNTVLNRLRQVEQLTGRTLTTPKDIVELALALEEFRMRTAGSNGRGDAPMDGL